MSHPWKNAFIMKIVASEGKIVIVNVSSKVCACTHIVRQAHRRKLRALIDVPSCRNVFCTDLYTAFQIEVNYGQELYVNAHFKKLNGTLVTVSLHSQF